MTDAEKIRETLASLLNAYTRIDAVDFGTSDAQHAKAIAEVKQHQETAALAASQIAAGLLIDINRIAHALEKIASNESGGEIDTRSLFNQPKSDS